MRTGGRSLIGLVFFLGLCFAIAGVGGFFTNSEIPSWYAALRKPAWTPPDWLFGPVWAALYAAMGVAAWLAWRRGGAGRAALWLFFAQLALNLGWSIIFFGLHRPGLAFAEIVLLWAAIAATITAFAPIARAAAWLLVPYLGWVTFAAALNFSIWRLNA